MSASDAVRPDVLTRQVEDSRRRLARARVDEPLEMLRERALAVPPAPSFEAALRTSGVAVIAEVKRASPSRGPLAGIPDPAALAVAYRRGGAAVVSVLTAPLGFEGSLDDLRAVAATGVPALRKDFLIDPYQVWEARAAGAAAVLLLAVVLEDAALASMLATCSEAGIGALVEVHDEAEMRRMAGVGPAVVGVNVRDLRDFTVDPSRFGAVAALRPSGAVLVAESGVHGPEDVLTYAASGADAVLVGEHLATSRDPAEATAALVEAGLRARSDADAVRHAGGTDERVEGR